MHYTVHMINDEVLKSHQEGRTVIETIRQGRKNWIRHVLGVNSLVRSGRKKTSKDNC